MRSSMMRALIVLIALVGFSPMPVAAQTPLAATPQPNPSFEITVLGISELPAAALTTPAGATGPEDDELVHALLSISIEPGAPVPPLTGMRSVLITVQHGSLLVSASGETVRVNVGTGEPVRSGDEENVLCEQGDCVLEPGQAILLGSGNGLSVTQGDVQIEVHGDESTVVQMSVLQPRGEVGERCWICPRITS